MYHSMTLNHRIIVFAYGPDLHTHEACVAYHLPSTTVITGKPSEVTVTPLVVGIMNTRMF